MASEPHAGQRTSSAAGQAGGDQEQAIRSAEQNESARRARRTRAKGGAAQDVPSPTVRQAGE
ncbi:hypothetical protein WKH27_20935 [Pantoea agglomerans]|uniref:hypothetical protein n=1 Tax=Enterobacter agglomerans TaxID=549 RepID=UPI0014557E70|nr:hypothetical protein [Pantoea agglomerans]WEC71849.1 hypothetical protein LDO72_15655 [Pantoea agglomerans]WNK52812.1 hypothetical protein RM154_15830 [Pantoea agglomerans]WNK70768.1 hypothetical protein RM155_15720 [Pantoea agglomerans]